MYAVVPNGTNAGWRVTRERPTDWKCPTCKRTLKYYWTKCPADNARRPD